MVIANPACSHAKPRHLPFTLSRLLFSTLCTHKLAVLFSRLAALLSSKMCLYLASALKWLHVIQLSTSIVEVNCTPKTLFHFHTPIGVRSPTVLLCSICPGLLPSLPSVLNLFVSFICFLLSLVNVGSTHVSLPAVFYNPSFGICLFFPFSEPQATWLGANKGTSPALERLRLVKITAQSRDRRDPPSDHSGLVLNGGAQPSFQPSDKTQRTTKIEGLRQANSGTQSSHSSAREPSRHCEHSEKREPSDSELSQHASLISWQRRSMVMWQLKATLPSSQSSRKSATTSLSVFHSA